MTEIRRPRLSVTGLTKSFGGARALDRADLAVFPGEIHGLLGKNGSGKSTLIKILSGFHAPDAGELHIDGAPVPLPMPPGRSKSFGLAFVHQNLGLLHEASVLENLIAGDHERLNPWRIDWRAEARRARALFQEHHLALSPEQSVADLSPVMRAQLAIVRAADRVGRRNRQGGEGILVLDEPTPFLPIDDVRQLFTMMRRLAARGISIIFVSHDLDEVMDVTDRATVLRDGRVIDSFTTAEAERSRIVEAIVGRSVSTERMATGIKASDAADVRVEGLSGRFVRDISFEVSPGEVLGLTGLIGAGHDEVPYLLSGARSATGGRLVLCGVSHDLKIMEPARAMSAGIALIPADRQRAGVAPDLSLIENATLPVLANHAGGWRLNHGRLERLTQELIGKFSVKADSPDQPALELSGGNQQKLVLAKWLQLKPILLVLDEPTQGIDIGARREIYEHLATLCAAGGSVICATSEFEQLETIAHRVLVFDRGRIKFELKGNDVTKSAIAQACYRETPSDAMV